LPLSELEIIKEKTNIPIIKTLFIPLHGEDSGGKALNMNSVSSLLEKVNLLEETEVVDSILLDTAKSGKPGGTGCVHDWALSRRISEQTRLPLILAGGLKPENVQEAIRAVSPYAVDTASGVETRGKKDAIKIKSFIEKVRCADAFL
jgi:phosphoribosylanthranilate isomerase